MSVRKLPSGKWRADWLEWKFNPKKERECWVRVRQSFKTKTEAQDHISTNRSSKRGSTKRRTIEDAIKYLSQTAQFSKVNSSTRKKYLLRLNQFQDWCDKNRLRTLQEFTIEDAEKFSSSVIAKYRGKGIENRLWLTSQIFKMELQRETPLITRNPFDKIKKSGYTLDELPVFLNDEQILFLRSNLRPDELWMFELLYNTGMRQGELLNLTWDRVFEERTVLAPFGSWATKNKRQRSIPNNKRAKLAYEYYRSMTGGKGWVLTGKVKPSSDLIEARFVRINRYLNSFADCPVKHLTAKMLRSTFGSRSLQAGASIESVSATLGHSNVRVTQKYYATLLFENKQQAVDVLD